MAVHPQGASLALSMRIGTPPLLPLKWDHRKAKGGGAVGSAAARLRIPVFGNLFFGQKKPFLPGFLRISFFLCFPEEFFTGTWFWRWLQEFLFFAAVTGIFRRNSCGTGIPVFTPDSSGFLRIPPDSCSRQTLSGSGQRLK